MSVVAAAVIGSSVVGAVVSKNASDKAVKSAERSEQSSLDFDKEMYQDWKDTYGDIEDNLAEYYGGLSADYYEAMGLEAFQQEYETNMTQMKESLSQRGILDDKLSASLELQGQLSAAETKATIRRDSEMVVNQEKRNFLQIGLGQNPAGNVSQNLANQAAASRDRANASEVAAGQAVGNAIGAVGTGISDYYRDNPIGGGEG